MFSPVSCLHICSWLIYTDIGKKNANYSWHLNRELYWWTVFSPWHATQTAVCSVVLWSFFLLSAGGQDCQWKAAADSWRITVDLLRSWAQQSPGQRSPAASPWKMPASFYQLVGVALWNFTHKTQVQFLHRHWDEQQIHRKLRWWGAEGRSNILFKFSSC